MIKWTLTLERENDQPNSPKVRAKIELPETLIRDSGLGEKVFVISVIKLLRAIGEYFESQGFADRLIEAAIIDDLARDTQTEEDHG